MATLLKQKKKLAERDYQRGSIQRLKKRDKNVNMIRQG